jgi:hypothetical protein
MQQTFIKVVIQCPGRLRFTIISREVGECGSECVVTERVEAQVLK